MVLGTGVEPVLPTWKAGVLATWPTEHDMCRADGRIWTPDPMIKSHVLYQLS